jgi:hypothetical protein
MLACVFPSGCVGASQWANLYFVPSAPSGFDSIGVAHVRDLRRAQQQRARASAAGREQLCLYYECLLLAAFWGGGGGGLCGARPSCGALRPWPWLAGVHSRRRVGARRPRALMRSFEHLRLRFFACVPLVYSLFLLFGGFCGALISPSAFVSDPSLSS